MFLPGPESINFLEERNVVKGWRSKLIFMFLLYFAGFATAVYFLAEPPNATDGQISGQISINKNFESQKFIESFNSGLHKSVIRQGNGTPLIRIY